MPLGTGRGGVRFGGGSGGGGAEDGGSGIDGVIEASKGQKNERLMGECSTESRSED